MNLNKIWQTIVDFFNDNFWNIILFFAVLLIGIIVVKLTLNILKRIMSKSKVEKVTQGFLYHLIKFCLYLILILVLCSIVGIEITGLITAISAVVLAIGLAIQNLIANIANGIVIVSLHLFKTGDYISVSGFEGVVEDVNFIFTTIITIENRKVTIPNSTILNNPLVNYSKNMVRRVDVYFTVAYETDVELVKSTIVNVMKSNGKVLLEPEEPVCRLNSLDASGITFWAYCWIDNEDYLDVYFYIMENVFNEFKRNHISVPFQQVEVRERKDDVVMPVIDNNLSIRIEKERKHTKKFIDLENDNVFASIHEKNRALRADFRKHQLNKKQKKDNKQVSQSTNHVVKDDNEDIDN